MSDEIKRRRVLIVDDDKNTRDGLERALRREYDVTAVENAESALVLLAEERSFDIMLSDVRMPGMDGLTLLQRALARQPGLIGILLTAYGNVEMAVDAMKRGAFDFLMKPVNLDHLDLLLKRAVRSSEMENENEQLRRQLDDKYGMEQMIGSSVVMQDVFEVIRQAAPTQATILIQGESGTGKELVAQAIHRMSSRSKGAFVAVHCAALAPTLLESELFGHEKGAFTGATGRRVGRFELADGGTLFLDEISETDPAIQVKLLRVLEERRFERVGGEQSIEVDIRLIAATNKNLQALVTQGKFREDLFFRLDVVNINLPPLRDRVGDVALLGARFIKEFAEKNAKQVDGFTPDAMDALNRYQWPGNVRELRNTVEKMVVLSRGPRLTLRDVPVPIRQAVGVEGSATTLPRSTGAAGGGDASLADVTRQLIFDTLRKHGNNRSRAAQEMGMSRRTLHRKLNEYEKAGLLTPELRKRRGTVDDCG